MNRTDVLEGSAKKYNIQYEILGEGITWLSNAIKIRLLRQFLETVAPTEILLVFDAYDVAFFGNESELLDRYKAMNTDVLFSAESNFYFQNKELEYYYWKYYPRSETYFDYLNSGSFMGSQQHLLKMINDIEEAYQLNFNDNEQIKELVSDQYLFSRFYVDLRNGLIESNYTISLDHQQQIFGCSGGRMALIPWPVFSKTHNFFVFKYERRLLKSFLLQRCQQHIRDFEFDATSQRFLQKSTGQNPLILHLPATKHDFEFIYNKLVNNKRRFHKRDLLLPLSFIVSTISYLESLAVFVLVLLLNGFNTKQNQIFRFSRTLSGNENLTFKKLANSQSKTIHLSHSSDQIRELPQLLRFLKKNRIGIIIRRNQTVSKLNALSIIFDWVINESDALIDQNNAKIKQIDYLVSTIEISSQMQNTLRNLNPKLGILLFGNTLDDLLDRPNLKFMTFPMDFPYTGNIWKTKRFLFGP